MSFPGEIEAISLKFEEQIHIQIQNKGAWGRKNYPKNSAAENRICMLARWANKWQISLSESSNCGSMQDWQIFPGMKASQDYPTDLTLNRQPRSKVLRQKEFNQECNYPCTHLLRESRHDWNFFVASSLELYVTSRTDTFRVAENVASSFLAPKLRWTLQMRRKVEFLLESPANKIYIFLELLCKMNRKSGTKKNMAK